MKKILITQRQDNDPQRNEVRDSLDIRWHQFLGELEIIPTLVPNIFESYDQLSVWLRITEPDGLILSGGNDFGDYAARDQTETLLLQYAEKNNLPVLGVCRGLQMLVLFSEGEIVRLPGHVGNRHSVYHGDMNVREVNSYHRFGIKTIPADYICCGKASDGSIEQIQHKTLPWHGIMWHPERENYFCSDDKHLFQKCFKL